MTVCFASIVFLQRVRKFIILFLFQVLWCLLTVNWLSARHFFILFEKFYVYIYIWNLCADILGTKRAFASVVETPNIAVRNQTVKTKAVDVIEKYTFLQYKKDSITEDIGALTKHFYFHFYLRLDFDHIRVERKTRFWNFKNRVPKGCQLCIKNAI